MVTDIFNKALAKYKTRTYDWPKVSCVSFITALSQGLPELPDYSKWQAKTEKQCLRDIRRLAGVTANNYINAHAQCLGDYWVNVKGVSQAGDIVFAESASGRFTVPESYEVIDWQSFNGFPATLFPDDDNGYWCFAPVHGMKKVHGMGKILRIFRRADI